MTLKNYKSNLKTKNLKIAIAATGLLLATNETFAQTSLERSKIKENINQVTLDTLKTHFQTQHNEDELRIRQYLLLHPEATRTYEQNGSVYFLQKIGMDGNPIYINTKNKASGEMIRANQLYPGGSLNLSITGTGMVTGIWDGGQVRATHELLTGHVTMQAGQTLNSTNGNNHMTHVSGTMVGKDIANQPSARGIAYDATAQNYDWDNDKTEMTTFAGNGFLISNHSYGYANDNTTALWVFGAYDAESKAWDAILKTTPNYLPFVAVGNEQQSSGNPTKNGYDIVTGSSSAKNVMTVGALNGDSSMSDYSNWGPTDDGRFKPEIVAKGTGINSSYYASDTTYSGNGVNSSGTSYATPAAAASGLLLQQYHNSLAGNYMLASTLKAVMMHTASDLGNPGPDYKFGWGLLNVEHAAKAIKGAKTNAINLGARIEEITTNPINNATDELLRTVTAKGGEPLVISLSWTDDDGTEQLVTDGIDPTTGRLVYSFDMMARDMTNTTDNRPWSPMGMANRTVNATAATSWFGVDNNNYKQIYIANPTAGTNYNIYIRKSATSPATARTLSLVVTGINVPAPTGAANQNFCAGATLAEVDVTGVDVKWYDAAANGNLLPTTTALVDGTIYYASQTGYSESATRLAVTVAVNTAAQNLATSNLSVTATQSNTITRFINGCTDVIAQLQKSGNAPVSGSVTAKVWIEPTAPTGFVKRHYEITPATNAATATGKVTLYFTQAEFDTFNLANVNQLPTGPADAAGIARLLVEKIGGTSNNNTGLPNSYTGATTNIDPVDADIIWNNTLNRWEVNFSVTGFSGFFVKTTTTPLPLKWITLNAKLEKNNQGIISWEAEEKEVESYGIQKSIDGKTFNPITSIKSLGNGRHKYSFIDTKVFAEEGNEVYYRIAAKNLDGTLLYSNLTALRRANNYTSISIFPNPSSSQITITSNLDQAATIIDAKGAVVMELKLKKGDTDLSIHNLPIGVYTLRTTANSSALFIKQ